MLYSSCCVHKDNGILSNGRKEPVVGIQMLFLLRRSVLQYFLRKRPWKNLQKENKEFSHSTQKIANDFCPVVCHQLAIVLASLHRVGKNLIGGCYFGKVNGRISGEYIRMWFLGERDVLSLQNCGCIVCGSSQNMIQILSLFWVETSIVHDLNERRGRRRRFGLIGGGGRQGSRKTACAQGTTNHLSLRQRRWAERTV